MLVTALLVVFMGSVRDVLLVIAPIGLACVLTVGATVLLEEIDKR